VHRPPCTRPHLLLPLRPCRLRCSIVPALCAPPCRMCTPPHIVHARHTCAALTCTGARRGTSRTRPTLRAHHYLPLAAAPLHSRTSAPHGPRPRAASARLRLRIARAPPSALSEWRRTARPAHYASGHPIFFIAAFAKLLTSTSSKPEVGPRSLASFCKAGLICSSTQGLPTSPL